MAKLLRRDHQTIKCFVATRQRGRIKHTEKKRWKLTAEDSRNKLNEKLPGIHYPPVSPCSKTVSYPGVTRGCRVLREIKKAARWWPPLNGIHKCQKWAKKWEIFQRFYGQMKWEWLLMNMGHHFTSGARGEVWLRAVISKNKLVGAFQVEDGLKVSSSRKKSAASRKAVIFMQVVHPQLG